MKFKDIADLSEDERVTEIGEYVTRNRKAVAFATDEGNADRYITKLQERYPGITVISRGKDIGSWQGVVWVKVGPQPQ